MPPGEWQLQPMFDYILENNSDLELVVSLSEHSN